MWNKNLRCQFEFVHANLTTTTLQRILRQDLKLHPYKPRLLQELSEEDFAHRMTFSEEMIHFLDNDEAFLNHFVFTDEKHTSISPVK